MRIYKKKLHQNATKFPSHSEQEAKCFINKQKFLYFHQVQEMCSINRLPTQAI